jgi:magnesium transporter
MGCTVGSMLPLLLRTLGIDPATSSAPFIASLVDVLGIVAYFNIASYLLHDVRRSRPRGSGRPSPDAGRRDKKRPSRA